MYQLCCTYTILKKLDESIYSIIRSIKVYFLYHGNNTPYQIPDFIFSGGKWLIHNHITDESKALTNMSSLFCKMINKNF